MSKDLQQAATLLGKKVDAPKHYDSSILVRVNRDDNRVAYDIDSNNLPFVGYDVWNAYEISFLTTTGLPIALVAKIVYPASSKYIVESKSLKLYLNSFNMTRIAATRAASVEAVQSLIAHDLSSLLETNVVVEFFGRPDNSPIFQHYPLLEDTDAVESVSFAEFKEQPALLVENIQELNYYRDLVIGSNLLRSNCKVTHQADWGSIFIRMRSKKNVDRNSVLKYIVSFRDEFHFHEEVVEMVYKRFLDTFEPLQLMVAAVYTRRGGIDICPIRATSIDLLEPDLVNSKVHCEKLLRQ